MSARASGASRRPSFCFATCPVGAENVLRSAIPERFAGLRPAFSRPGLLTFKASGEGEGWSEAAPRPHPLARLWGTSLGSASSPDEVEALLSSAPRLPERPRLAVVAGEPGPLGKVPEALLERWEAEAATVERELRLWLSERWSGAGTLPAPGDAVIDVVVRPEEPWLVGWHRHIAERGPLPKGRWPLSPPEDGPSRAWTKLEELVAWSGAKLQPGELALELGCAPGGATVALLDRGLRVVGVDPQDVALPERLADAPFVHLRGSIEAMARDALPDEVSWIVVDLSVAAPVALHALQRLVKRYRSVGTLRGVLLTLKLNEWSLVERAPDWLSQLTQMGLSPIGPAHLPSMRQEVGMAAFVQKSRRQDR